MDAAWPGGENCTMSVRLHAVGKARQALVGLRLHVVEQAGLSWHPIRVKGIGHQMRQLRVRQRQIERAFIGRQRDPIGPKAAAINQAKAAVRCQSIDTVEIQFAQGRGIGLAQTIRRVSEIDRAVGGDNEVVGAVEALALKPIDQDGAFPCLQVDPHDGASATVGNNQMAVPV